MNEFQKTPQSETSNPSASDKAPFVVTDLVLILTAIGILTFAQHPLSASAVWTITLLVASGAWIAVIPWILEHRAKSRLSELEGLTDVQESIRKMNTFSDGVNSALLALSNIQQIAQASAGRAAEAEEKIAQYGQDFEERISRAAQYEKSTFQLEIDKLRRIEKEWVASASGMLDHILALASAGIHSGKPEIAEQMKRFRAACLDIASRAGIQPYMPAPTEHYDPEKHTVPTDAPPPETAARIIRVLAPGFLYQGQLTRKALILTEGMEAAAGEPAGAQGVTHSFASSPFEPAREETSSFTPAEPLEVDHEEELSETPEPTEQSEFEPELEPEPEEIKELSPEEEILAEVESEIELAEEPLDDSEALFRQESFESLSSKQAAPEPEESPAEDEPSEPIEIETEELGEIEESWSQEEPPEEDEPDESPDDEERLPL
ncbi:MAG: hypothetical protein ACOX2U_04425 [Limisphaerales bacterium]|jgi:hypothetical protein|nr:hypothetical protein [Verrucomicrobiota bacterium]